MNDLALQMTAKRSRAWVTVVLASLGGAFEMYDFIIYGVFAREIGVQFFATINPVTSLLSTFSVFAIGYISRPFGGIFMGSLGDRYGRRIVFLISILATSVVTIAIGIIPGYSTIGVLAPVLLIILRMAQGAFLAGELPCSITYVVEEIPRRAGLVSGTVIACVNAGILAATLVSLGIHLSLSAHAVSSFGWRIAFIIGGILGLISYRFRSSLEESKEFRRMQSHVAKRPFREVVQGYWKQIALGLGIACIVNTSNSLLFVVLPSYMTGILGYAAAQVSVAQSAGLTLMTLVIVLVAWISDMIPSRYLHRVGAFLLLFFSYPIYNLTAAHQLGPLAVFSILGSFTGLVNGTYAYLLADIFPARIRFSGVAIALNLSTVVFTALTPIAVTLIFKATGLKAAPGIVLTGAALIAILAGLAIRRSAGQIRLKLQAPEPA